MPDADLMNAIRQGNIEEVQSIISTDTTAINRADDNGNSPLHIALVCDIDYPIKHEIVSRLISAGADVNAIGDYGWTPLHLAVKRAEAEIAEELICAGARVDVCDGYDTPLDISLRSEDYYCIGLLLLHGASISLHSAVLANRTDWVRWILSENPNATREDGLSVILVCNAIRSGNLDILRQLITSGAEINQTPERIHPLWTAVERGNIDAVRMLLEAGADPNGRQPQVPRPDWHSPDLSLPLEIAKEKGLSEIEALLKQYGATA